MWEREICYVPLDVTHSMTFEVLLALEKFESESRQASNHQFIGNMKGKASFQLTLIAPWWNNQLNIESLANKCHDKKRRYYRFRRLTEHSNQMHCVNSVRILIQANHPKKTFLRWSEKTEEGLELRWYWGIIMNCICENGNIVILICSSLLEIHSKVFMDGNVGLLVFVPEEKGLEGG